MIRNYLLFQEQTNAFVFLHKTNRAACSINSDLKAVVKNIVNVYRHLKSTIIKF